jgi:hypothetical protein
MMQASKKIPFEDPNVLMGVRVLYIVSNLVIVAVNLYVKMQIDKKKGGLPRDSMRRTRGLANGITLEVDRTG